MEIFVRILVVGLIFITALNTFSIGTIIETDTHEISLLQSHRESIQNLKETAENLEESNKQISEKVGSLEDRQMKLTMVVGLMLKHLSEQAEMEQADEPVLDFDAEMENAIRMPDIDK